MDERRLAAGLAAVRDAIRGEYEIECESCHRRGCDACDGAGGVLYGFAWTKPLWTR